MAPLLSPPLLSNRKLPKWMSRLLMRCSLTAGSFHQLILLLCASAHGVEAPAGFGEDVLRGGEDTAGLINIWVWGTC